MTALAYTIGRAESYDQALAEATAADPVMKIGRDDDRGYLGGWAWKTKDDAEAFVGSPAFEKWFAGRAAEFVAYEIELPDCWAFDVYGPDADGAYHLEVDARVVGRAA